MFLVKVYNVVDGDYIMEYHAPVVPNLGDTIFIEDLQVKVANVYHIVREFEQYRGTGDYYYDFERVEIEVEVIG